jgi:hypothetical protein
MVISFLLALSLQCFTEHVQFLSSIEIQKDYKVSKYKPVRLKKTEKMIKTWDKVSKYQDVRILSLAWMESRLRPWSRRGDEGQACGIHQIHARYSYPLFRRKRGFNGWDDKTLKSKNLISRECAKLEVGKYSMGTMEKLLKIMDRRSLHPCHHNSGIYAKCNSWYKARLNIVTMYLYLAKEICKE